MNIVLIDNGTRHLQELVKLLNDALKNCELRVVTPEEIKFYELAPDSLVVISGAGPGHKSAVTQSGFYDSEIKIIRQHKGPVIGICLGMELIALAFDGHVVRQKRRIKRIVRVKRANRPEADFLPSKFKVFVAHRFSVRKSSSDLIELASSRSGLEIFRHTKRDIYGMQFHPEVRKKRNNGKEIFLRILDEIKISTRIKF